MFGTKLLLFIFMAIAALGVIFGLGFNGGDDPVEPEFVAPDASEIAASFSQGYSGFFGQDFYLADGETASEARDYYPNESSGRTSADNYVVFKVLKDKAAAKSLFDSNKSSYSSQIGRTVMGSTIAGTTVKSSLDDAMGYYNNLSSSTYLYYTGYYGNAFFESYCYLKDKAVSDTEVHAFASAIYKAIVNPASVDLAKRYVEPIPEPADDVTCRLLVYGNANQDNYLDSKDLELVQRIAVGSWDSAKYPYADANADGKVDSADVEVVKRFLAGQPATMYYTDWNLNVSSIQYPLSGRIAGTYDSSLWFAQIVGVYDDVKYLCRTQAYIDALREDMFPGASKNIAAQGSNGNFDPEKLIANNIKVVIGDPFGISAEYLEKVSKFKSIQTVLIPENRDINGLNWSNSVVTLGVMFNKQENTREYVEYIEKVEKKIEDAVAKATADEKDLTYLLIYAQPGSTGVGLDVHSTGTTQYGDVMNVENLPLTCVVKNPSSNWLDSSVEDVLAMDPDVIIFTAWGPFQNNYTQQQYAEFINGMLQDYKTSSAYKNGRVYSISYEVYGTLPGISGIPYLGSQIWPNLFDEEEGVALLQEYFDKFTYISGRDVRTVPTLLPLTLAEIEGNVVPPTGTDAVLTVLGNADLDSDMDSDDVKAVEYVVSIGGTVADYPYCDANNDGAIDQKDVKFVQDMVAKKKQVIYYFNVDGEIASVHYPVTGKIIATYNKTLEAARTLGLSSQVIAIDDFSYEWPTYFPEFMNLPSIGSRFNPSVEKVLDLHADAYLCGTKKWFAATLETDIGNSDMDVIRLPTWEEGQVLSGMTTLGYITQHEAQAKEYVEWADGILSKVEAVVGDKSDSDKPTVLVLDAGKPLSTKKAGSGQYENSIRAGGYNVVKDIGSTEEYYTNLTMEWILNKDPDFIVFSQSSTAYQWDDSQLQSALDKLKGDFALTTACSEGRFHILNLEVFIGPSYPIGVLYMAKWFYPEEFADVDVSEYLQDYIDRFCGLDMDVVEHGGFAL